jgi:hypothetical protein
MRYERTVGLVRTEGSLTLLALRWIGDYLMLRHHKMLAQRMGDDSDMLIDRWGGRLELNEKC